MKAVRFDEYGAVDVLDVREVPVPEPGPGQVLVKVKAAGINPGEAKIRDGCAARALARRRSPPGRAATSPASSSRLGPGVTAFAPGDEVIGWVDTRSSQAEYVVAEAANLAARPAGLPWEIAGAIPVAGFTAWAMVRAVGLKPGDTVVVSGAAGGVGSIAVQLARRAGATVIGLAGPSNHDWLTGTACSRWPTATAWPSGSAPRPAGRGIDAFLDTYGGDYVELALNDLKVSPERVDTIVRFDAVAKYGIKAEGNAAGASAATLAELADLVAAKELEIPLAHTFPLSEVRAAYTQLAKGHVRGKIVLIP